jgi:hypothetical protein
MIDALGPASVRRGSGWMVYYLHAQVPMFSPQTLGATFAARAGTQYLP